jgi:hypothetical protein
MPSRPYYDAENILYDRLARRDSDKNSFGSKDQNLLEYTIGREGFHRKTFKITSFHYNIQHLIIFELHLDARMVDTLYLIRT